MGIVETFGTSFEFGALPNKSEDFGPSEPCKGALQDAAGSSFNAELQHLPHPLRTLHKARSGQLTIDKTHLRIFGDASDQET